MKNFLKTINQNTKSNYSFIKTISKSITAKDVKLNNTSTSYHIAHDPTFHPEEKENYQKEFFNSHPSDIKLEKFKIWAKAPYNLGLFDTNRDTELRRFAWNTNGFMNPIAKILYRSKIFQNQKVMRFFMKFFNHRFAMDINKAEEPPKLTTNSIFLYKDSSNTTLTRRGMERLVVFMVLTQAWNLPAAFFYIFIAWYLHLLQKNVSMSKVMVKRLDLLPETEQIHLMKIGLFGFPKSELMSISDLIKVEKEDDLTCN
jgi:hypothetical protein